MKKHIFIIGSKGIPANYGGYETFVDELTAGKKSNEIVYHVACKATEKVKKNTRFEYNGSDCFNVYVPQIGAAQAIYYDISALNNSIRYVKKNEIKNPIFYILACRIGPFMYGIVKKIHNLGGEVFVNPDGHEWLRAKWSYPIRRYWKLSERLMVKHSDLLICDSKNIEKYIHESYEKYNPKTTFIAYGADVICSSLSDTDSKIVTWFNTSSIQPNQYYLIVGRFVPENNYETIIREFIASDTTKDLVIITNVEKNKYFENLKMKTKFQNDQRIKFVGTVYDLDLLKKIRENAYGYFHGHSVGGTNPSLLEAMASTQINLLFNVGFNREVAEDSAFYWSLNSGDLAKLINHVDSLSSVEIEKMSAKSIRRIEDTYSWKKIISDYEKEFSKGS